MDAPRDLATRAPASARTAIGRRIIAIGIGALQPEGYAEACLTYRYRLLHSFSLSTAISCSSLYSSCPNPGQPKPPTC